MSPASAVHLVDLHFQGQAEYIATGVLDSAEGPILVDPGPSSTLLALEQGLADLGASLEDVSAILLTHIHLDHAGVAGILAEHSPKLRILVHRAGARHLLDPSRLLASATRLYGDQMDSLWGAIHPVPERNLVPLDGGEECDIGGRRFRSLATPGHAVHHMAWLDDTTGIAFVGDATGERFPRTTMVIPVTPPPDIDVEAMLTSTAAIRDWHPMHLFLTHFGLYRDVTRHLDDHDTRLRRWSARVAKEGGTGQDEQAMTTAFAEDFLREYTAHLPPGMPPPVHPDGVRASWAGLARYHRKRAEDRG